MANRIFGRISPSGGSPIPSPRFRVRAWDQDWPDGDDFLGESLTDENGQYAIPCMGRIYDEVVPGLSTGFPDIYITVELKNKRDDWVQLGQSQVFNNYDLADDLKIDLAVVIEPPIHLTPFFDPKTQGFHFRNDFRYQPDFLNIEFAERDLGFCGGMCAAARHRFLHNKEIPETIEIPKQGSELYEELMRRQIKSMPPTVLTKMFYFQAAPDTPGSLKKASIGQLTKKEWPQLKAQLDQKIPTVLILLRAKGLYDNPTKNHQVLAVGYAYDPARQDLEISVYDPNIKEKINTLTMSLALPDGKLYFKDSSRRLTRGFFVNDAQDNASQ